ncbi:3,4-dihydroxyphenylacetate 2,3-dioxygenase [Paenibacillus dendritiformis]|uniref:3,4-dihydroxyphenylacetate 2,3-dioxygenase n=1 Tax=Paenibacillus dendritiformis TaxID=130049 RepID=UPI003661C91B
MDFSIIRIGNVIMNVTDLDQSRKFYVDALGFIETESDENNLYLRGLEEHNHHCLHLIKADKPGIVALGYKVMRESDLDALERLFASRGLPTRWIPKGTLHAMGRALHVQDVSGLPLQFYAEMDKVERLLQRYDLYTGARIQRIDHVNCFVPDVARAYDFFVNELGFACSEYTALEDDSLYAAWLHRKHNVHDQAFMNGAGPRLHHVGFWLPDPLALIHACDVLASLGYQGSIERGPGRHGLSNAFFLYLRDPDGIRIELYNGDYLTSDPDLGPIKWDIHDPRRQTFWGSATPESWFNEGTPFVDIWTGEHAELLTAALPSRQPQHLI